MLFNSAFFICARIIVTFSHVIVGCYYVGWMRLADCSMENITAHVTSTSLYTIPIGIWIYVLAYVYPSKLSILLTQETTLYIVFICKIPRLPGLNADMQFSTIEIINSAVISEYYWNLGYAFAGNIFSCSNNWEDLFQKSLNTSE